MMNLLAYELLRNTLSDARGLNLQYFEAIDTDITAIDCRIRANMTHAGLLYEKLRDVLHKLTFGEILILKDSFLLNYVLFLGDSDFKDFFVVGPFRSLPFEETDYLYLRNKHKLSFAKGEELQAMLQPIPSNIMRVEALAAAHNILSHFYELKDPVVWEMDLEAEIADDLPLVPLEDINIRALQIEETYMHESKLLGFITEGNFQKAIKEAEYFMHSGMVQRLPNARLSHRSLLYSANTLFRKASQGIGIHPVYLDDISKKYVQKLSLCVTHQQMNELYLEMIEEYCSLCRNYPTHTYSRNVQKITNYILLNLSSNLTPDIIAQAINFSPNYISRKFKEEVGISPMTYITEQRMRVAKRLLEGTNMSVREIAIYVGIPDWNYFTKLFKKTVNLTPSEYKRVRTLAQGKAHPVQTPH